MEGNFRWGPSGCWLNRSKADPLHSTVTYHWRRCETTESAQATLRWVRRTAGIPTSRSGWRTAWLLAWRGWIQVLNRGAELRCWIEVLNRVAEPAAPRLCVERQLRQSTSSVTDGGKGQTIDSALLPDFRPMSTATRTTTRDQRFSESAPVAYLHRWDLATGSSSCSSTRTSDRGGATWRRRRRPSTTVGLGRKGKRHYRHPLRFCFCRCVCRSKTRTRWHAHLIAPPTFLPWQLFIIQPNFLPSLFYRIVFDFARPLWHFFASNN